MIKKLLILGIFALAFNSVKAQQQIAPLSDNVIAQANLSQNISMYPNPAHEKLRVDSNSHKLIKVTIYNVIGDALLEESVTPKGKSFDISTLTNGVYIVSFTDGKSIFTKRLVKN